MTPLAAAPVLDAPIACQLCGCDLRGTPRRNVCKACGWEPSPGPQYRFLELDVDEKLYGGAAGGGKSEALLMNALRLVHVPEYRAIIFRRTFADLKKSLIERAREHYPRLGGKYNETDHLWRFPSGALIYFGHLEHESTVYDHKSAEYHCIEFDELTSFTEFQYRYMQTRLRSSGGLPTQMAAGTNPGDVGHDWVLKRWAPWLRADDPKYLGVRAEPGQVLHYVVEGDDVHWISKEEAAELRAALDWAPPEKRATMPMPLSRVFVPSRVTDNPYILQNDPTYIARIESQDRVTREQLLRGNWLARPGKREYFRREWFEIVDELPSEHMAELRWWDRAATKPNKKNPNPAATAGVRMCGPSRAGDFYIVDVKRIRDRPVVVEKLIGDTVEEDGPRVSVYLSRDPGSAGEFEADYYIRKHAGYDIHAERESGEKTTRAKPVSAQAEAGHIKLLRGDWNDSYIAEAEDFPDGKKDQIDATSGAFSILAPVTQGAPTPDTEGHRVHDRESGLM
jgi:predicted phage terminase large subunit-like protein